MDDLPATPTCPHCGTVVVDDPRGLVCRQCGVLVHPAVEVEYPEAGGPGIHGG